ncbi:DUF1624 domain-containing protein [Mesorhizobium sp. SB112]|uniref:heparan-alpha-glucosaminide N-acetyltransferase n=1 Tax=Mesorhizobium sp. SB112 TaxID=3151853 RepID=UPI0032656E45
MNVQPVPPKKTPRLSAVDLARGAALVAMAIYHFTWDLEFFGYTDPGMTAHGGWKLFARCIASSFLFLVGFSLFLAHVNGVRWRSFSWRLAMVAGAALAISAVTYFAVPGGFIFFGILHQIALASVLGLAFLRVPAVVTILAAAAVIAAPFFLRSPFFDHAAFWWVGLSSVNPRSNDYVPLFPWFGAVLLGLASAKIAYGTGLLERLAPYTPGSWAKPVLFASKHSLAFYLIHQPVLIACIWLFSQIVPAQVETREVQFLKSCQTSCEELRDTEFCTAYCVCMLDSIQAEGALDKLFTGGQNNELQTKIGDFAAICTAQTDENMLEGGTP